jgi:hypothetical protein
MNEFSYIGRCPICDGLHIAVVDAPEHKKDTAKTVKKIVESGLVLERVKTEWIRSDACKTCECKAA